MGPLKITTTGTILGKNQHKDKWTPKGQWGEYEKQKTHGMPPGETIQQSKNKAQNQNASLGRTNSKYINICNANT